MIKGFKAWAVLLTTFSWLFTTDCSHSEASQNLWLPEEDSCFILIFLNFQFRSAMKHKGFRNACSMFKESVTRSEYLQCRKYTERQVLDLDKNMAVTRI